MPALCRICREEPVADLPGAQGACMECLIETGVYCRTHDAWTDDGDGECAICTAEARADRRRYADARAEALEEDLYMDRVRGL